MPDPANPLPLGHWAGQRVGLKEWWSTHAPPPVRPSLPLSPLFVCVVCAAVCCCCCSVVCSGSGEERAAKGDPAPEATGTGTPHTTHTTHTTHRGARDPFVFAHSPPALASPLLDREKGAVGRAVILTVAQSRPVPDDWHWQALLPSTVLDRQSYVAQQPEPGTRNNARGSITVAATVSSRGLVRGTVGGLLTSSCLSGASLWVSCCD
jgi:hypothetical protein